MNQQMRHLVHKKQKSILLITEWADPRFHHGVALYAKEAGWHLTLDYIYSHILPWGWHGDGCIAMAGRPDIMKFVRSLKIPVVDVTHQQKCTHLPRIHEDDQAIGALAADYFLRLGFKNFAWYSTDSFDVSTVRHNSFVARLKEADYTSVPLLWDPKNSKGPGGWAQRKKWLTRELKKLPRPTAVFCIDDRMAINIIDACMDGGISIPNEISVLGVGNLNIACECSGVPLSSIRIDFESFGYQAASMLDKILNRVPIHPAPVLLSPLGIEERRSTYTLAVSDPAGQKALRFMLDHFTSPINIDDIAKAGGITRRQLTYIIHKELNEGPAQLLESIRIKKAFQLLKDSNYTVERVAYETGLGNALRLQRIFRKLYKTSPGRWRKMNQFEDAPIEPHQ
jgi:LacI family transcriptional regulator